MNAIIDLVFGHSEVWTTILGATIGAIVSAIVSYLIHRKTLKENRQLREEEQRLNNQVLANSMTIKMMQIHGNVLQICNHFNNIDYSLMRKNVSFKEDWMVVVPFTTFPGSVFFTSAELSLLLSLKNNEVFNAILNLDQFHESLIENVKLYAKEREILYSNFKPHHFEDHVGSISLSKQELIEYMPSMITVKTVLSQLQERSKEGRVKMETALVDLHKLLKKELGLEYSLQTVDNSKR